MLKIEIENLHVNGERKYLATYAPAYKRVSDSLLVSGHLETDFDRLAEKIVSDLPFFNQRDERVTISMGGLSPPQSETLKRLFD